MSEAAIDGALLDEAEAILAGRDRETAITAGELSDRLDLADRETSPKAREVVRTLLFERGVPIRSSSVGYWVCQSEAEAEEYRENLRSRIEGTRQRLAAFDTAWEEWSRSQIPQEKREQIKADPVLELDDFDASDFRPEPRSRADGGSGGTADD